MGGGLAGLVEERTMWCRSGKIILLGTMAGRACGGKVLSLSQHQ